MSIFQPDLLWYTALKAGLADMRQNTFLMEDAYSQLASDSYMKALYGQKEIERFKAFLAREIAVFTEFRVPDIVKFPAIVIKIGGGNEDGPKDALGDSYQEELVNPATLGGAFNASPVVLGPVTPQSFDPLTGTMVFGPNVNLIASQVFDSQYVFDVKNKKAYPITLVLDQATLLIDPPALGDNPDFTNMLIQKTPNSYGHIRRSIWVWEQHSLELMATDATELLYLFTIVMYILMRYKKQLWDARNFAASTISYTEVYRVSDQSDPNNVYGRQLTIRGRVEHSVIESTQPILGGLNAELLIADMSSPEGVLPQVEQQGWKGEEDP
jgi:hypothetical protein